MRSGTPVTLGHLRFGGLLQQCVNHLCRLSHIIEVCDSGNCVSLRVYRSGYEGL